MKLSTEQKLIKQQRDNLQKLCNSVASAFSFKQVRTWLDVYKKMGISEDDIQLKYERDHLLKEVKFPELKAYFETLRKELDERIAKKENIVSAIAEEVIKPTEPTEEIGIASNASNNYGLPDFPHQKAFLYWFQKKAVKQLLDGILGIDISQFPTVNEMRKWYQDLPLEERMAVSKRAKRGQLLLSGTGSGKTFMAAAVVSYLRYISYAEDKTVGPVAYLYVTRASIVEQTKRVFENLFDLSPKDGVEILNIEQLRSRAGALWVNEKTVIIGGQEKSVWVWRKLINPAVVLWDECQALKNEGTVQSNIGLSYNELPNTIQLFISATPFTRVSEARCFAISTRKVISDMVGALHETRLSVDTWPTYASSISSPSVPTEYNEAACERLSKDLDNYIVRVKGVRPQFEPVNKIELIDFETKEEKDYYDDTEARYLREKEKLQALIDAGEVTNGTIHQLVLLMKRCMAAELCRKHHIARRMYQYVEQGYAAVAACKYKPTIIAVTRILVEEMGVPRDEISLIWGGGQTALTAKQKAKAAIKAKAERLEELGLDAEELLADFDLTDVEDRTLEDLPEYLRLGAQSKEERQREIDRFQSGRTLFCLFTFKAGGVGLSLHHSDEFTQYKVRRKPSGYAVEEDIPNCPTRPRKAIIAPTYSAIELVQGLGRCPRLTSLSPTEQTLLFYRHTVEEGVAAIVSQKLRCLSKVVRMRESWQNVIVGAKPEEFMSDSDATADEDGELLGGGTEVEDE